MRRQGRTSTPSSWVAILSSTSLAFAASGCGGSVGTSPAGDAPGSGAKDGGVSSDGASPSPATGDDGAAPSGTGANDAGGTTLDGSANGTVDASYGAAQWLPLPPADLGPGMQLSMTPFSVAPGAEVDMCQVFANPFGSTDTDLLEITATIGGGADRAVLFALDSTAASIEPAIGAAGNCAGHGLEFHPVLMLSQQPQQTTRYPTAADGSPMGYRLSASKVLMLYTHYLNPGSSAVAASAAVTVTPAKAGVVTTHIGNIMLEQATIAVPANTPKTSPSSTTGSMNGDPSLPPTYSIVSSQGYLGHNGLSLTASTGGTVFYKQSASGQPGIFLHVAGAPEPTTSTGQASPVTLTQTSPIEWDCAEYNTTAITISAGDSSLTNAWCLYVVQYYPADPSNADVTFIDVK